MNGNIVGTFFNILDKVATENHPSDTPGNICNIYGNGIQINNKPDSVIIDKGSKNVYVLPAGEKSGNAAMIACCNAARQFLPLFQYLTMSRVACRPAADV
jgi:hypothetical protein